MSSNVVPLKPQYAAEPGVVDKREATCRARCALLGRVLQRRVDVEGEA